MANVGIEHFQYFCPRKKSACSLVLYYNSDSDGKTYTMIECDQKLGCAVYVPSKDSVYDWEYCPAYHQYEVV